MAQTPANQKLYAMVVTQAKQKYRIYPSPGASHWVHKRYLELGGKFVDEAEENQRMRIAKHVLEERAKREHHGLHNKKQFKGHHKDKDK